MRERKPFREVENGDPYDLQYVDILRVFGKGATPIRHKWLTNISCFHPSLQRFL